MIFLRRNDKDTSYFEHNNDVMEVGELCILKEFKYFDAVPSTAKVLIKNQLERIGEYSKSLALDIDCFDYVTNKELDELYFESLEDDNFENCPEDCHNLIRTPDMFGTGDSPTGYDCDCHHRINCPLFKGDI